MQVHKWRKQGLIYTLPKQLGGQQEDWRQSHVQMPIVDTSDMEHWRIYYSSRNQQGLSLPSYIDVSAGQPENILRDHKEPILSLGGEAAFDRHGIMPSAIHSDQDKKYLYYIGWSKQRDVPYKNAVGLAISRDGGKSFTKHSRQPILQAKANDSIYVGTLHAMKQNDNLWHGYYMSCVDWREYRENLEPIYHIKYASSTNGIEWKQSQQVAIDFKEEDEGGIVAATVYQVSEKQYWMWFCYRKANDFRKNKQHSYRIGFARSSDGVRWKRDDAYAGIERSETSWDSEMICYPCVVAYKKQLYMFYNGNGFGQSGIGYATLDI